VQAKSRKPVLMIGLDAAEISLIEKWMSEGSLPNMRALKEKGAYGPLASSAEWLVGSPWPTFYTSTPPTEHGMYHYLIWRPELMKTERPNASWLPLRPFWRNLGGDGKRVIAIDVPLAYAPEAFDGMEVAGWATHETLDPPASFPPDLLDKVTARFGSPPFGNEETYVLSASELLGVRDQCIRTTEHVAEMGLTIMAEQKWDLFMLCFAATHRGGHQLWDLTSMIGDAPEEEIAAVEDALRQVYIACDRAIGRLIEQAGPDTVSFVFSLHGMGPNASRSDLLREMIDRILERGSNREPSPKAKSPVRALRELLPIRLRSHIKNRLPTAVQDRLTLFWRTGGIDWRKTRAFAAFCDLDGYIKINLKGREAEGIVEPGEEYRDLCDKISSGLMTFADEDSGEPIVEKIGRVDEIFPEGRMRDHLPDLIIHWSKTPASSHRRIVSPQYGGLDWPTPGHHPQGRSGNHWPRGFLMAAGDTISPGTAIENATIMDVAPTVLSLLGAQIPPHFRGRVLF